MERLGSQQTKDRIASLLRQEIVFGRFQDGEELAQEQLAAQLEVSRMPVREALQTLAQEGFLRRLPNRHMQVVGLTPETLKQNMNLIAVVEHEAVKTAIQKGDDALSHLDSADDDTFHRGLTNGLKNHYIQQTHHRLLDGYPKYIWSLCKKGQFQAENESIRAALIQNAGTAEHAIRTYYAALSKFLLTQLDTEESYP